MLRCSVPFNPPNNPVRKNSYSGFSGAKGQRWEVAGNGVSKGPGDLPSGQSQDSKSSCPGFLCPPPLLPKPQPPVAVSTRPRHNYLCHFIDTTAQWKASPAQHRDPAFPHHFACCRSLSSTEVRSGPMASFISLQQYVFFFFFFN